MGCGHCKHMNHEIVEVNSPDPWMLTGLMRKNLGTRLTEHCVRNWNLFAFSHLTYSHLTYSHFTYFRPKSDVLPTLKKDMKGSEPGWSNQKQVTSQIISVIICTNVGVSCGRCNYIHHKKTLVTATISGHLSCMPVVYVTRYKLHGMLPILIKA